ncbi:MAG: PIN domain-containing protein [Bradymonadales bacterium]|nr:PIN domain-containing protein [Bradymonadales bacterium]
MDTNILVYAAERSFSEHERARAALEEWRGRTAAWYLTWNVIYEFVRIITHPRVFRRPWSAPAAWRFVEALLASPGLKVLVETSRHQAVAREVMSEVPDLRGNLVHDAHTAIVMLEHGIRRIYTRDTDFHRFGFLEVIDPLG